MVPGRLLRAVVNVEVDQPVLVRQDERHVLFGHGFGMADVPGQAEMRAFQEQVNRLIEEIFDFSYSWEVYTPAAKRKFGYYVLPVLYKNKFII